ncbi:hypothetical protein LQW54_004862 [Pestalotiopsis sp. IQ-011]
MPWASLLPWEALVIFPGPLVARITNGYAGYHAMKGDIHLVTYRDHLKYGIIKIGSVTLIFMRNSNLWKGPVVQQAPNRLVFNTLTALQDHWRRRRAVGEAISERSMRDFEPAMASQIDIFLTELLRSSRQGQAVDMTPRCKYLAMDVIGLLAFGASWKTQTEEALRILPRAFSALNPRVYMFMNWPKTHSVDPGVQWLARAHIQKFRQVLAGMISERMALPRDAKHDLFSFVASDERIDQAQQEGIRKSVIWGEAGVFVNAGKYFVP